MLLVYIVKPNSNASSYAAALSSGQYHGMSNPTLFRRQLIMPYLGIPITFPSFAQKLATQHQREISRMETAQANEWTLMLMRHRTLRRNCNNAIMVEQKKVGERTRMKNMCFTARPDTVHTLDHCNYDRMSVCEYSFHLLPILPHIAWVFPPYRSLSRQTWDQLNTVRILYAVEDAKHQMALP